VTGERAKESQDAGRGALLIFADYVNKGEACDPRAKNTTTNGMCAAITVINNFTGTAEQPVRVPKDQSRSFSRPESLVCVCVRVSLHKMGRAEQSQRCWKLAKRERQRERESEKVLLLRPAG